MQILNILKNMDRVRGYAMLARLSSNAAASVRSASNSLPAAVARSAAATRAGGLGCQQRLGPFVAPQIAGQHSTWVYGSQRGFAAAADSSAPAAEAVAAHESELTFPGSIAARRSVPENQGMEADRTLPVLRMDGTETGATVVMPGNVFDVAIRPDIVQRVVLWQLARRQQGTHKTKDRSEVSGTGKKPHAQKGTGKARAGTKRAPHHRGGGVAHGPVVRSHAHDLQRKVRRLGLKCALSARLAEGQIIVIESMEVGERKTAVLAALLRRLEAARAGASPAADASDAPDEAAGDAGVEGAQGNEDHDDQEHAWGADEVWRGSGSGGGPAGGGSLLMVDASAERRGPAGESLRRSAAALPAVEVLPAEGLNVYSILQRRVLVLSLAAVREITERLTVPIKR